MELCISGNKTHLSDPTNFNLKDLSVNGLKTCLKEFPSIEDAETSTTGLNISFEKNHKGSSIVREDAREHSASGKCFNNHVAFLALGKSKSSVDEGKAQEEDKAFNSSGINHCVKPINQVCSQPTPPKPVSAMKGSRKTQGKPTKNLSVTWAPDVYDPIPTSVSHVPSNSNQRKKHGKKKNNKKQKGNGGKSSRRGKDKKQAQRNEGNTNTGKSSKGIENELDSNYKIVNRVREPFCGSSFLTESMTNSSLHFPVTEAK